MFATMPAQEIKRRGMSALNGPLRDGPVFVIANNRPRYVVLSADEFRRLNHERFVDQCRESMAEWRAGLSEPVTVDELMSAFDE